MNNRLTTVVVVVGVIASLFLAIVWLSFTGATAWFCTFVVLLVAVIMGRIAYKGTEPWLETKGTWFGDDEEENK